MQPTQSELIRNRVNYHARSLARAGFAAGRVPNVNVVSGAGQRLSQRECVITNASRRGRVFTRDDMPLQLCSPPAVTESRQKWQKTGVCVRLYSKAGTYRRLAVLEVLKQKRRSRNGLAAR